MSALYTLSSGERVVRYKYCCLSLVTKPIITMVDHLACMATDRIGQHRYCTTQTINGLYRTVIVSGGPTTRYTDHTVHYSDFDLMAIPFYVHGQWFAQLANGSNERCTMDQSRRVAACCRFQYQTNSNSNVRISMRVFRENSQADTEHNDICPTAWLTHTHTHAQANVSLFCHLSSCTAIRQWIGDGLNSNGRDDSIVTFSIDASEYPSLTIGSWNVGNCICHCGRHACHTEIHCLRPTAPLSVSVWSKSVPNKINNVFVR